MSEQNAELPVTETEEFPADEFTQEVDGEVSTEGTTETPVEEPKATPTIESLKRMIKAKIDGEEFEKEVDLSNEDELRKMVQFSALAQKRAQEAAELKKVMDQRESTVKTLLSQLQTNPLEVLRRIPNVDLKEMAASILNEQLEEDVLTPEQKRIRELEKQIQEKLDAEKKIREQLEQQQKHALREKYKADLDRDLKEAINEQGLKYNPAVVTRMVQYMSEANNLGLKASFKDLAPIVKADLMKDIEEIMGDMPSDALEKLIRAERLDEITKKRAPKPDKKKAPPTANDVKQTETKPKSKQPQRHIPMKDFFKSI